MTGKNLKYRDLPWDLRRRIDSCRMQPTKSQNPTVKHIINVLVRRRDSAIKANASASANDKQLTINLIEDYTGKLKLIGG